MKLINGKLNVGIIEMKKKERERREAIQRIRGVCVGTDWRAVGDLAKVQRLQNRTWGRSEGRML